MSGAEAGLAISVFLACAVEAVEALTIVLAVGTTRSWSSAMSGVGAATVTLAAIVAALGPALTTLPIDVLRVLIGGLLLMFGLQWLRKAILRSAGLKARHDELAIFRDEIEAARAASTSRSGFDGYAFAISFKGVLLEGLEVAFIVLTFGANQHRIALAAGAASIAVLIVVIAGIAARAPLAKVPENTMKFAVGVMLTSFGTFWGTEGAGASWPGNDAALLAIVPGVLLAAVGLARMVRQPVSGETVSNSYHLTRRPAVGHSEHITRASIFLAGIWDFVVGDDWRTALGIVLGLALTALLATTTIATWWIMPPTVIALLALSIRHAARLPSRDR
ncbi:MAG TPA: hypothetical protein VIH71_09800 [Solirubrobacteraceae bacterium]